MDIRRKFCRDAGCRGRALSQIESGVYGLQPEKMLILYEKYRIEPTYLVTGDTNHKVDIELFLANCSREERDAFIDRMLAYMRKLMTGR